MLTTEEKKDVTLPENHDGEEEMVATVRCAGCDQYTDDPQRRDNWRNPEITIACNRRGFDLAQVELKGVLTCGIDKHRWPVQMRDGSLQMTATTMPSKASASLSMQAPDYIRQDVEEAEEAHFYQLFKSSVVMCRRALQLGIETRPNAPPHKPLGPLLLWAREQVPPILTVTTDALAEGIKDYGDAGAHRVEEITSDDAAMVIHITVRALNELFP